jgi:hypothetical protein
LQFEASPRQINNSWDPILKLPNTKRTGGVAQVVKCLTSKCEALSSNSCTTKRKKNWKPNDFVRWLKLGSEILCSLFVLQTIQLTFKNILKFLFLKYMKHFPKITGVQYRDLIPYSYIFFISNQRSKNVKIRNFKNSLVWICSLRITFHHTCKPPTQISYTLIKNVKFQIFCVL